MTRSLSRVHEERASSSHASNGDNDERSTSNDKMKMSDLSFTPAQARSYSSSTTPRVYTGGRQDYTPTAPRRLGGEYNTTNHAIPLQDTGLGNYGNLLAREQEMAQLAFHTSSEIADLKRQLHAQNETIRLITVPTN